MRGASHWRVCFRFTTDIAPQFAKKWKKFFEENLLSKVSDITLFVAHSLDPTFLIKYISENDLKIKTALFVPPAVRKNPDIPEIEEVIKNYDKPIIIDATIKAIRTTAFN